MEQPIRHADVLVENFAPGAMDRMGVSWEHIQELNPRLIYGSVKGFNDQSPYSDLKVYENVARCAGGAASQPASFPALVFTGAPCAFRATKWRKEMSEHDHDAGTFGLSRR